MVVRLRARVRVKTRVKTKVKVKVKVHPSISFSRWEREVLEVLEVLEDQEGDDRVLTSHKKIHSIRNISSTFFFFLQTNERSKKPRPQKIPRKNASCAIAYLFVLY